MDYKKIYNNLITSRILLNRIKNNDGFLEKHHIIPKGLGGTNTLNNLVLLTPREHYIAHWLLYKIHIGKDKAKMAYAFFCMCRKNPNQKRDITSKMYERTKLAISASCYEENHPSFGKVLWDEEARKNISKRMTGVGNSRYGKDPWNKGLTMETSDILLQAKEKGLLTKKLNPQVPKPRTEEFKQKVSKWMTGVPKTEECKRKLSEINKGKKLSQETKDKMSTYHKTHQIAQVVYKCPHCGLVGKGVAMIRWHFNNCTLRK